MSLSYAVEHFETSTRLACAAYWLDELIEGRGPLDAKGKQALDWAKELLSQAAYPWVPLPSSFNVGPSTVFEATNVRPSFVAAVQSVLRENPASQETADSELEGFLKNISNVLCDVSTRGTIDEKQRDDACLISDLLDRLSDDLVVQSNESSRIESIL